MENYFITIEEAIEIIAKNTQITNKIVTKKTAESVGYFLATDITSPINMPPFHQSAMDGYAVCFDDEHQNQYNIVGMVAAGTSKKIVLQPGEATRIFTGAAIPEQANAVIMQENTTVINQTLNINDSLTHFKNIRPEGEQIKKNEIALPQFSELNPAAIGYLQTLGITKVPVFKKPKITILVTGDELIKPGKKLTFGKIYESNSAMLHSALHKIGFNNVKIKRVKDNYKSTVKALKKALIKNEFVLISGGISVGDFDYVKKALDSLNTKQLFYKVKQKPGKPFYFGKNKESFVFALPGNPASALTCFYVYIQSALQKYIGNQHNLLTPIQLPLATAYDKKGIRAEFLKAQINQNTIHILTNQSSAMLNTYAIADALIYLPEEKKKYQTNELVTVYKL